MTGTPFESNFEGVLAVLLSKMGIDFEEEHTFNIKRVSTVWLLTALCVVPLAVYFLLSVLSPIIHRLTAMMISEVSSESSSGVLLLLILRKIYVYPIKSLRPVKVKEAVATKYGFQYDRRCS